MPLMEVIIFITLNDSFIEFWMDSKQLNLEVQTEKWSQQNLCGWAPLRLKMIILSNFYNSLGMVQ